MFRMLWVSSEEVKAKVYFAGSYKGMVFLTPNQLQVCPWKHTRFFFFLERNNCNFPLTEEDQIIARIVELLKYSGGELEREVGAP